MSDDKSSLAYRLQSFSNTRTKEIRQVLAELHRDSPLPPDHLLVNLGLYQRSSVVAKFLYLNELYQLIIDIPGVVMEFGVWWGQTLVQFQNLRAVYEPYNHMRKIIGFDTFTGYNAPVKEDGSSPLVTEGQYNVSAEYIRYLEDLMSYHEAENTMSHIKKFELVKGDATQSIRDYLKRSPETVVALACFDMQLYEPTKACLEAILPHMVRGSVIAMDELYSPDFPGETLAFRDAVGLQRFKARRSRFLPDRTYFIVE